MPSWLDVDTAALSSAATGLSSAAGQMKTVGSDPMEINWGTGDVADACRASYPSDTAAGIASSAKDLASMLENLSDAASGGADYENQDADSASRLRGESSGSAEAI